MSNRGHKLKLLVCTIAVALLSSIVCASYFLLQWQQLLAQSNNDNSNRQLKGRGILTKVSFSDVSTLFDEGSKLLGEGNFNF